MSQSTTHRTAEAGAKLKLLASMLLFGTIGVFVRAIPLPSSVIALIRGVIGTAFLLLVSAIRHTRVCRPDIRRNLPVLCLSGACIGVNWILLFEAYRHTTVAVATLCYYLAPIFVILASPFVLHERLTAKKALCAAVAFIGMALVSGVFSAGASGGFPLAGVLFGLGAAAFYACVILLNKRLTGISSYDTSIVQLAAAALVLLPYALLDKQMAGTVVTPLSAILLLTVGVVHTGVAYALYFSSMKGLNAQTVAIGSYIDPIVAILLSAFLLHEPMDAVSVAGAILILAATFVSELPARKKAEPPAHREHAS